MAPLGTNARGGGGDFEESGLEFILAHRRVVNSKLTKYTTQMWAVAEPTIKSLLVLVGNILSKVVRYGHLKILLGGAAPETWRSEETVGALVAFCAGLHGRLSLETMIKQGCAAMEIDSTKMLLAVAARDLIESTNIPGRIAEQEDLIYRYRGAFGLMFTVIEDLQVHKEGFWAKKLNGTGLPKWNEIGKPKESTKRKRSSRISTGNDRSTFRTTTSLAQAAPMIEEPSVRTKSSPGVRKQSNHMVDKFRLGKQTSQSSSMPFKAKAGAGGASLATAHGARPTSLESSSTKLCTDLQPPAKKLKAADNHSNGMSVKAFDQVRSMRSPSLLEESTPLFFTPNAPRDVPRLSQSTSYQKPPPSYGLANSLGLATSVQSAGQTTQPNQTVQPYTRSRNRGPFKEGDSEVDQDEALIHGRDTQNKQSYAQ